MEAWELIRRLLAGATGPGQTFTPGLISATYYQFLLHSGQQLNQTFHEISEFADSFSEEMEQAGLIRHARGKAGGAAILGAMERTELGDELFQSLCDRNVVSVFEAMDVAIDTGEIQRVLHQLDS